MDTSAAVAKIVFIADGITHVSWSGATVHRLVDRKHTACGRLVPVVNGRAGYADYDESRPGMCKTCTGRVKKHAPSVRLCIAQIESTGEYQYVSRDRSGYLFVRRAGHTDARPGYLNFTLRELREAYACGW